MNAFRHVLAATVTILTLASCGSQAALPQPPQVAIEKTASVTMTLGASAVRAQLKDTISVPLTLTSDRRVKSPVTFRFERTDDRSSLTKVVLSAPTVDLSTSTSVRTALTLSATSLDGASPEATYRVVAVADGKELASAVLNVTVTAVSVTFKFETPTVQAAPDSTVELVLIVNADSQNILPFTLRPRLYLQDMEAYGELAEPDRTYEVTSLPARIPVRFHFKSTQNHPHVTSYAFDLAFSGLEHLGNLYASRWLRGRFTWEVTGQ